MTTAALFLGHDSLTNAQKSIARALDPRNLCHCQTCDHEFDERDGDEERESHGEWLMKCPECGSGDIE